MIHGLDHIAVAVENIDNALEFWQDLLGGILIHREVIRADEVESAILKIGTLHIELLAPVSEKSPIKRFLSSRGPGLHHIALECDSTQAELDRLKDFAVRLIDLSARPGARNSKVGFVHPSASRGVLLEFVDHKTDDDKGSKETP